MSELKTLKDLFGSKDHCLCAACGEDFKCDIEIIRQEAIKIIKYLENKDEVIYDGEKLERHYGFYDLTLFKLFFNITEEDLEWFYWTYF